MPTMIGAEDTDVKAEPRINATVHSNARSSAASAVLPSSDSTESTPDEIGTSDELKVFKDEGDDDDDVDVNGFVGAELQEEKSSLITESEQARLWDPFRLYAASSSFPVPGFPPHPGSLAMSPYLMSSYAAAAAAYANGSHLARYALGVVGDSNSCGNVLTSPPPAHLGSYLEKAVAGVGLRSSFYGPQYSYSSINEQLAAWHQQAQTSSMYEGALRSATSLCPSTSSNPYSLGSLSGFSSPLNHLSPNGFHIGLTAAASGINKSLKNFRSHVKHDENKQVGVDLDTTNGKQCKELHIKKPLNAFMIYMKETRSLVQAECTLKESAAINQILGRRWHGLSREEQAKYYEKARTERQKHMQMYPHWNARDNYRYGLKRKKRRRDKSEDLPGGGMKKCRARYGLDKQDYWCKPCKRKKKCIRVQAYMERKKALLLQDCLDGTAGVGSNGVNSRTPLSEYSGDGEEEDGDTTDSHRSASMSGRGGGPHSVDDNALSDTSAVSPAGYSLSSIGSPAASITSPLTPYGDTAAGLGDWLRHYHHNQATVAAGSGYMNTFRPPVGTDPRDAKNPLSVSQLTDTNSCSKMLILGGAGYP